MEPVLPNTPMRGWSILTTIENVIQQERPQCGGDTEAVYAGQLPMDADTCGDETSMHFEGPQSLVNIAHIGKVKRRRAKSLQRAYENISTIAGTSYRLTLFAPCLQQGRKTQRRKFF